MTKAPSGTARRIWCGAASAAASTVLLGLASPASAMMPASATTPATTSHHHHHGRHQGRLHGALFGGDGALVAREHALGRRLAIVRSYYRMGEPLRRSDEALMAGGRTLLVSVDTTQRYTRVSAGADDAYLRRFLRQLNAAAARDRLGAVWVGFEHEADLRRLHPNGTPAQYKRAFRHVIRLGRGLDRIRWAGIYMARSFIPARDQWPWERKIEGQAAAYWPGRPVVPAVDGYDSTNCGKGTFHGVTPQRVFGPAAAFAARHHTRLLIAEWGASAHNPPAQLAFIRQMARWVPAHRQVRAVMYWDSSQSGGCSYVARGRSLAALRAMGHTRELGGRIGR
jgi:hypothetical protein